jgi:hypothetical protein
VIRKSFPKENMPLAGSFDPSNDNGCKSREGKYNPGQNSWERSEKAVAIDGVKRSSKIGKLSPSR